MEQNHTYLEITRQPITWQQTIEIVLENQDLVKEIFNKGNVDEVVFIGCGTSYYISIAAALTFQEITGLTAKAVPASEIFLKPEAVINKNKKTVVVGSSRSGNTTEVVRAIDYIQKTNLGTCISVTGNPDSDLAKVSKHSIVLPHIKEKSVVMTGSFTNILLTLQLFAGITSDNQPFLEELSTLPNMAKEILPKAEKAGKLLGENLSYQHYIYLGLGSYYGLACEGMLKMKEMTQTPAEAFNPLEFRHGPISVVNEACRVILLSNQTMLDYEENVVKDLQKYGANTVLVGQLLGEFQSDETIHISDGYTDAARGILYMPYLQFIAYFRTMKLGLDPDNPRNLSQVVVL